MIRESYPSRTMSVGEAAAELGIGKQTLYRLIAEGESPLEPIRLGSRLRIRVKDLDELLEGDRRLDVS